MKNITFGRGKTAFVDDADYEFISRFRWWVQNGYQTTYAVTRLSDADMRQYALPRQTMMHRLIMRPANGTLVDHIDGNGLNNTRANLRLATAAENHWNTNKRGGTSAYKGVSYDTEKQKWCACLMKHYKKIHLGYHLSEIEAAAAYNKGALLHFGEFARLNRV